jgi:hypothetical protein
MAYQCPVCRTYFNSSRGLSYHKNRSKCVSDFLSRTTVGPPPPPSSETLLTRKDGQEGEELTTCVGQSKNADEGAEFPVDDYSCSEQEESYFRQESAQSSASEDESCGLLDTRSVNIISRMGVLRVIDFEKVHLPDNLDDMEEVKMAEEEPPTHTFGVVPDNQSSLGSHQFAQPFEERHTWEDVIHPQDRSMCRLYKVCDDAGAPKYLVGRFLDILKDEMVWKNGTISLIQ